MRNEVLVRVENLSKKFCRDLKRSLRYGLWDIAGEMSLRKRDGVELRRDEFWALKDISFELRRGECLGLIGRNGAGKSTVLKLLNGLIKPTQGHITVFGSMGALIELNSGANPILTGRENIYINASVLGVPKKEVDSKLDDIIDFSGVREFIDTPVMFYSSGMKVRLGFAIATSILEPDVLILDEVLAVGDAPFRSKCYSRIGQMTKRAAVILVSHDMGQISRLCDQCLYLEEGRGTHFSDTSEAIQRYLGGNDETTSQDSEAFETVEDPVKSVKFEWSKLDISYGETIELTITIETSKAIPNAQIQIPVYDMSGVCVAEWDSRRSGRIDLKRGSNRLGFQIGPLCLKNGVYKLAFVLHDSGGIQMLVWSYKKYSLQVSGSQFGAYTYQLPVSYCLLEEG